MSKQLTNLYLNIRGTASNCVNMSESDRDLIEGVETYKKRYSQTDIHGVTYCGYKNLCLIYFSNIVQINSFSRSWCIQQSISNNRLDMGRTWPSVEWVQCHYRGGILAGVWPWPFTKF